VNVHQGVLRGRPHGGLAVMWRKSLNAQVQVMPSPSPRLLPISMESTQDKVFLVNTYMPYQCDNNYEEFMETLGMLSTILDEADSHLIAAIGDFNAGKDTPFLEELQRWCVQQHMTMSSSCFLSHDNTTFVSMAHGTSSWLDHVITSTTLHRMIERMVVQDIPPSSDHAPVCTTLAIPCTRLYAPAHAAPN
jgi:endonuclease/exonuclease/phosphatase family metal-dependent hydrolase